MAYRYLLHEPAGRPGRRPLLLFLHGIGERGARVRDVARHGPVRMLEELAAGRLVGAGKRAATLLADNFVVVAPQCPRNRFWDSDALVALVDTIARKHRIDSRRVYVTGLSMGGFGAWNLLVHHPERFAAAVPVCGALPEVELAASGDAKKALLRRIPVWAFHGALDRAVPLIGSTRSVAALRAAGARHVRLTIYPRAGHDSWTETYANPAVYRWLLRQVRGRETRGEDKSRV